LQVAAEEKVVGAARRHRDANPGSIDIRQGLDRGTGRHQVGGGDLEVRSGEGDLLGALRLGADEGDIPGAGARTVRGLAGAGKGDQLDLRAKLAAELPGEVRHDAAWRAARRVLVHQEKVAQIDADAQFAGRREFIFRSRVHVQRVEMRSIRRMRSLMVQPLRSAAPRSVTMTPASLRGVDTGPDKARTTRVAGSTSSDTPPGEKEAARMKSSAPP